MSWDKFLVDCQLGPTQYWPNPSPRARRKRKVLNPGVNSSEVKESEVINMPINNEINENDDRDAIPCNSREILDKPLPGENDSNPANIKEGLAKGENDNNDEENKPDECNKESMHKLDHLA